MAGPTERPPSAQLCGHPHRVFVYGTLRRGGPYHDVLGDAAWLWSGRTPPVYELVDLGEYPGVIEGGTTAVYGELYAISDATLQALDTFEEVPHLYQRRRICIGGCDAFLYILMPAHAEGRPRIASGVWPVNEDEPAG